MKRFLFNVIQFPIWLLALFSEAKSFQSNPIIGNAFLNQIGLHALRFRAANYFAIFRRLFLIGNLSMDKRLEYQANGFNIDFNFLGDVEFDALKKEVFQSQWLLREMRQGNTVTRRVFLDEIHLQNDFPQLVAFINHPELLSRIRYIAGVGGQPIFSIQAIFSDANEVSDPQTVTHADTFHSNAKAWFFLENIGEDDGPLAYVRGSHQLTAKRLVWEKKQSISAKHHPVIYHARGSFRALNEDLLEMGLSKPEKFAVPANTLVVADTMGFHCRSASKKPNCRVEIYATLRRNPFLPWTGLHIFSIPYFKVRSGSLSIQFLSWLEKVGLRKMPWRSVGEGAIKDPVRMP